MKTCRKEEKEKFILYVGHRNERKNDKCRQGISLAYLYKSVVIYCTYQQEV